MKKILVTLLTTLLVFSFSIVTISADDEVTLSIDTTKDTLPFERENILPGDSETKTYKINIYHNEKVTVYFNVDVTEQAYNLGDYISLTIKDGQGNILANQININDFNELAIDVDKNIDSLTFEITSYLDEDYNNSSDYLNMPDNGVAKIKANLEWYVKGTGGMIEVPKTGIEKFISDSQNFRFDTVMSFIILFLLIALFVLLRKKTFKNQIIKTTVLVIVGLMIFANTTYALYLARLEIKDSFFTVKKYNIDINLTNSEDKQEPIIITPIQEYFEPGRSRIAQFNIKNEGNIDVYYRIYISEDETNDAKAILMQAMTIGIYSDKNCTNKLFEIDGEDFNLQHCFDNDKDILTKGTTKTFYMLFKMDEEAGNSFQNTYSDFSIICEAIQSTNNEGGFINE